jgi:hypothetical protein
MLGLLDRTTKLRTPQGKKREYLDSRLDPQASGQSWPMPSALPWRFCGQSPGFQLTHLRLWVGRQSRLPAPSSDTAIDISQHASRSVRKGAAVVIHVPNVNGPESN